MTTRSIVTHQPDIACDVCGRRLLRGEQPDVFIDAGRRRTVCELCIPRATGEGWMREADMQAASLGAGRGRGGRSLLERLRARRELTDAAEQPPTRKRMRRLLQPREDEYGEAFLDQALGGGEIEEDLGGEDGVALEAAPRKRIDVFRRDQPAAPEAVGWDSETQEHEAHPGRSAEGDIATYAEADRAQNGELGGIPAQPAATSAELSNGEHDLDAGGEHDLDAGGEIDLDSSGEIDLDAGGEIDLDAGQRTPPGSEAPRAAAGQLMLEEGLDAFNASDYIRRVSGIARSLGSPSVRVKRVRDRRIEVLVAWELCWYRYEIDLDQPTAGPMLVADGMELHELPDEDMLANAIADERGRLMLAG